MQYVNKTHAILHNFIIKEHFQEMVKKTLKMRKCLLFLVNYVCMLTDC